MKKQSKLVSAFAFLALLSQVFVGLAFAQEFPQAPNEVQNVVAIEGNGQVILTWDEATDPDGVVNEYKVYFGTNTVTTAEATYDDEMLVGKVLTYIVTGLTNDTQYFFAVTAVDDEQTESDTYSVEVSATPTDPEAIEPPPAAPPIETIKVLSVKQNEDNEIQLEFSKDVFFTGIPLSALIVKNKETAVEMNVQEVQVKEKTVILIMVDDFTSEQPYQIIATTQVEDKDGNSVEAGVMDRIEFVANRVAATPSDNTSPPEDPKAPEDITLPKEPEGDSLELTIVADARNLLLDTSLLKAEQLILLEWEVAEMSNIADQVIFTRRGLEDWDSGYSIGIDISELELEVDMDENYEVMLLTIDREGNESEGVTLSFSTSLSSTGPGTIGTVVALMVIFMIGLIFFKKQQTC